VSNRVIDKIPVAYLKECFSYDPNTGNCYWKVDRPVEHFPAVMQYKRYLTMYAGKQITRLDNEGYCNATFGYLGKYYKVKLHQIIAAIMGIEVPEGKVIDHINRDKKDNRFCNLRVITPSGNAVNCNINSRNKSGYKGVCKRKRGWAATCTRERVIYYLGLFDTLEEAIAARQVAELQYETTGTIIPWSK
jgi:hypothetical protein